MRYSETEKAIAHAFNTALLGELGRDTYAEVLRLNRTAAYLVGCASHDFCDANLPMLAAYEAVMGSDFPEGQEAMDTWNRAWDCWRETTA